MTKYPWFGEQLHCSSKRQRACEWEQGFQIQTPGSQPITKQSTNRITVSISARTLCSQAQNNTKSCCTLSCTTHHLRSFLGHGCARAAAFTRVRSRARDLVLLCASACSQPLLPGMDCEQTHSSRSKPTTTNEIKPSRATIPAPDDLREPVALSLIISSSQVAWLELRCI